MGLLLSACLCIAFGSAGGYGCGAGLDCVVVRLCWLFVVCLVSFVILPLGAVGILI